MKKRILKFLVEWHEVSEKPMPSWLERRLNSDPELKESYEREREITRELSSRDSDSIEPNPYLAERIIANLDRTERTSESAFSWKQIPIALAACLAVFVAIQWNADNEESGQRIAHEAVPDETGTNSSIDEVPMFQTEGLLANVEWKNPLDQEIEHVLNDARGAVGFLADSFLPSTILETEREG